jgi:hypothetical protein
VVIALGTITLALRRASPGSDLPQMSRSTVACLTALLLCIGWSTVGAQAAEGLAVSPLVLEETPGLVTIRNGAGTPARLTVVLEDFDQAVDGSNHFFPLGTRPSSCAPRARFEGAPALLAPGATAQVRVTVDPGPLCWGVLMIEGSRDERRGNRVAVKFYHVPAGGTHAAEITGLQLSERGRGIRVSVRSLGSAPARPSGRVEFRDASGGVVGSAEVSDFGLHPGADRFVVVPIPEEVQAGRYVVLAVLDLGTGDLVAAQAVVDLPAVTSP